jgi:assimilatory nitrate reductase catalytic subunit
VPFGHARSGVLFRAAAHEAPPAGLVEQVEHTLGLADTPGQAPLLRYEDRRRGQRRAMRLQRVGTDSRLEALLLAGDTSAEAWLKALLQDELPAQAYGRQLLVPGAKPPAGITPRAKQVCTCFNVDETQIRSCVAEATGSDEQRLATLQQQLKCGTNCGSCIPTLKQLVRSQPVAA